MIQFFKSKATEILLFIFVFGIYAAFINTSDLYNYNLQQAGIESIVERGQFHLDDSSTPEFMLTVRKYSDVFIFEDHKYLCRQPGGYLVGSLAYFFINKLGVKYINNYQLASGLVTLFSAVLLASLLSVLFYSLFFRIVASSRVALVVAGFCAFGTLLFPYSGLCHHDIYSVAFLFASFYLFFSCRHQNGKVPKKYYLYLILAGFTSGISLFMSLKSLPIILVFCAYAYNLKRSQGVVFYVFALIVAFVPSFIYSYKIFGHPFIFPEVLYADYRKPLVFLNSSHIVSKIKFYFLSPVTSIWFYSPISILAFVGLFFLPKKYSFEKIIIISLSALFLVQAIVSSGSDWCCYGPRYLIHLFPFLMIGLAGYFNKDSFLNVYKFPAVKVLIILLGSVSVLLCSLGASVGTMYCGYLEHPFKSYLIKLLGGGAPYLPFAGWGIVIVIATLLLVCICYKKDLEMNLCSIKMKFNCVGTTNIVLLFILLFGFLLRVFKLGSIPNGLYSDEASIGYNAYCIAETLKDQYGKILPLYFEAFGDYKNPVLIYLSVFFIKLFEPGVFALRLTPCLLGVVAIYFTYKLTNQFFSKNVSLLAAFLLAVSPWHIHFSRQSMDPIVFPTLFLIFLYMFVVGINKNKKIFILSSLPLVLSVYSYAIAKLFIPLFLMFLFAIYCKQLLKQRSATVFFMVISFLLITPLVVESSNGKIQTRFKLVSITNDYHSINPYLKKNNLARADLTYVDKVKIVGSMLKKNYLAHLSYKTLQESGDRNLRHCIKGRGLLLWFTFWFAVLGFLFLLFSGKRVNLLFPIWLLLSPLPAATTWESLPHAGRFICAIPVFEIFAAVGFVYSLRSICFLISRTRTIRKYCLVLFCFAFLLFVVLVGIKDYNSYLISYFKEFPNKSKRPYGYDYMLVSDATKNLSGYDAIIIQHNFKLETFLFLQKIHPEVWANDKSVVKYVPRWFDLQNKNNVIRVVRPGKFINEKTILKIHDPETRELRFVVKRVR